MLEDARDAGLVLDAHGSVALAHLPDDLAAIARVARPLPAAKLVSALDRLARLEVTDLALLLRLLRLGHGCAPRVGSGDVLGRDGSTTRPDGRSGSSGELHGHAIGLAGAGVLVTRGEPGHQEHAE